MAFRLRADDGPTLNSGLVAFRFFRGSGPVLLRIPIFLWFFRGGGQDPYPPLSGSAHVKGLSLEKPIESKRVWNASHYQTMLSATDLIKIEWKKDSYRCLYIFTPFTQLHPTQVCFTNAGINNTFMQGGIYFLLFWWNLPELILFKPLFKTVVFSKSYVRKWKALFVDL